MPDPARAREIRANTQPVTVQGDGGTILGYAAIFDSPTQIGGAEYGWIETIRAGAFTASLAGDRDVLALYSHSIGRLLGRQSSGTLRLREDAKGLAVEIDLPDTSDGRDVAALVTRGDLKGMSFGFDVTRQEWDETVSPPRRTILEVDLYEVTVTADPAYEDTEIGFRSLTQAREARKAAEIAGRAAKRSHILERERRRAQLDLRARRI